MSTIDFLIIWLVVMIILNLIRENYKLSKSNSYTYVYKIYYDYKDAIDLDWKPWPGEFDEDLNKMHQIVAEISNKYTKYQFLLTKERVMI